MATPPAVSVVTPLYNKRATVERTIVSVLAQTLSDFELIIVDDGSSDGSPEFVETTFKDPRVRVVRQANAGPGAARNAGARMAAAPLVAFLDADDEWLPEFLATAVETLAAHPDCGAFTASFERWPERINRFSELAAHGFHEGPWRLTPETPDADLPYVAAAFSSSSAVYRREVFEGLGGFYTRQRCTLGEDIYLWVQVLMNHPIYRWMAPLAIYHMEDSELGMGARRGPLPLEPTMTDPAPLRESCPPPMRGVLERWLAAQALKFAFIQLDRGDAEKARWLVRAFPGDDRTGRLKLALRMAAPGLWAAARSLRRRG